MFHNSPIVTEHNTRMRIAGSNVLSVLSNCPENHSLSERDIIINLYCLHVKYPLFLSDFNETWISSAVVRKIKLVNIRRVGDKFFHACGPTDGQTCECNSRFSQICACAWKWAFKKWDRGEGVVDWIGLAQDTSTLLAAQNIPIVVHTSYSASWWSANKCSKHVEAINRNKLKANSASCWSYYTDVLRCPVNKTLNVYWIF
jgi:hypothetical protein